LHLIVDNYATHKHPKVRAWLERHPRFHFHFTPISASWLNAVEGFFAKLTRQRLKRGVFNGIDEKSQIQALDRTQPGLPMKRGRCGTMTHDYKRHGTTTLFAALDVLEGRVIGQCMARHRHQEFIRFLNKINRETPAAAELHLIVDNYATHKHPKVRSWLERHPRFHFHFTPTSASWLNAVEGFFAKLTRQRLKRGVFNGIVDLQAAINRFVRETNDKPKPFTWTADPDAIIEKVRRGKQALESIH
jgi:transposase